MRLLTLCVCALLLLFALAVEGNATGHESGLVVVTDFRGKQLEFHRPPERIICLIESALSGIYMLGEEQRVVGISRNVYDDSVFEYYAALDRRIRDKRLPTPGNWDFVNIESVIALRPDLVLIWAHQTESIAALEERGIQVFGVFIASKDDVYKEMLALGKLTGRQKRAEELVAYTKGDIRRFNKRVASIPDAKRSTVFFMWAQGNLDTSCAGSTVNDLIELAGARNVCASIQSEHTTINIERLLSWDPEVIVMWYNERQSPQDIILNVQWKRIRAVRDGRVHQFPEVFLCDLWTLKFQYAVLMVAKWAHPALFKDIDLNQERQRMLRMLYGRKL